MIVDSHIQIYSANPLRYPLAADRPFDPQPAPAELALVQMEQTGVDRACLVQPRPYGYDHRYLIDTLTAYPQRFVGVGRVDVAAPDAAASLRDLMQVPGLRGIRCAMADADSARQTVDAGSACWRAASDLGMIVCLQMRPEAAAAAARLAEAWPQLTLVIDHLGAIDSLRSNGAAQREAILGLARRPNVWIKCSGLFHASRAGFPYRDVQPWVRDVVAAFGADRVVWGSDFPNCLSEAGYERQMLAIRDDLPGLTAEQRASILGGAAHRLWRLA